MSPNMLAPNDLLNDDNYFLWKALAVLVKMLSPTYQMMVRNARSAKEAWDILQPFFVTKNLHNRVQLRKQLHCFEMAVGEDLMQHLLRFDELCMRLAAVGRVRVQ
ncbi:TPA: hypothetical protein N0F65_009390 [Lagenidium giganteum]|uniref:Retrotransposon Copia-like N-terminal domain-containing protein n=1 Tax=Lagenidium giganteum TaxID=4803 RepID=A0AAV2ZAN9_9STRA|nr:TPA: hypothetical protein N0F65_009390 [Lagenidium giganteum]